MYTLLYLFILGCFGSSFLHVEEEVATHSSILAWKTLQTEESDGLQPMRSQRAGHSQFLQLWRVGVVLSLQCTGFPLWWHLLLCVEHRLRQLQHMGSLAVACGSQSMGSMLCDTWAQLLHCLWNFPRPGVKPVSLVWAGEFLSTEPPGKSSNCSFFLTHNRSFRNLDLFNCLPLPEKNLRNKYILLLQLSEKYLEFLLLLLLMLF